MARIKNKCWSYNTGERGRNWVRAYEKTRGGIILLEWFEPVCGEDGQPERDARGKPRLRRARVSTGHRDRNRAEGQAKELAERLAAREPEPTAAEPAPTPAPACTLRQLINLYSKEVTPGKKESKRKHDLRAARVFLAYFQARADAGEPRRGPDRLPATLDKQDWYGFIAARQAGTIPGWERPCRNNQVVLDMRWIIAVLNWAAGADEDQPQYLAQNPWRWERRRAQRMMLPKEKDPRRPGISDEQHEADLDHSPNWRFSLVAVLCRETMHRMNSVRLLRKKDVNLETRWVRWKGEFDKTGRQLTTPLTDVAVEAIRSIPHVESPWLVPAEEDPDRPVSRSTLNTWMERVKERAGIDVERLGFHAYKRAGVRTKEFRELPAKVQEQLTGTTHAMLRRVYDEVPMEELEEAMEKLAKARRRA